MTKQEEIISGMLNLKQIYCHNCKDTKVECDKTVGDSLICRGNIKDCFDTEYFYKCREY